MSTNSYPVQNSSSFRVVKALLWIAAGIFVVAMGALGSLAALFLTNTPAGQQAGLVLQWALVPDASKTTWYVTRAAGLTAYLLLWLSTFWGLVLPTRFFEGKLHGSFTFEFHQFISLLSIAFPGACGGPAVRFVPAFFAGPDPVPFSFGIPPFVDRDRNFNLLHRHPGQHYLLSER
jgi:hypothetical protein